MHASNQLAQVAMLHDVNEYSIQYKHTVELQSVKAAKQHDGAMREMPLQLQQEGGRVCVPLRLCVVSASLHLCLCVSAQRSGVGCCYFRFQSEAPAEPFWMGGKLGITRM
jgi:predicted HD phosphohydrolase